MRAALIFLTLAMLITVQDQDSEHPQITVSSDAFRQSLASSVDKLKKAGFQEGIETPGLGSSSEEQFQQLVGEIRAETPIPDVSQGERGVTYDVILQPGHYGRTSGRVGTAGHFVSERALVAYITNVAAQSLRRDGDSVLVVSADKYLRPTARNAAFDGLRAKVFLAIHADGSVAPCSTHASLAYQSNSSLMSMHAVGWTVAAALGYSYLDFTKDNYTDNEAGYYMFRQVEANRLTGLLEVGELTCPAREKQLIDSSRLIGRNIAYAVNFIVRTPTE
jgi:N-acetylmuramoyl-L-alanine amidase